jgi:hypothetical protein
LVHRTVVDGEPAASRRRFAALVAGALLAVALIAAWSFELWASRETGTPTSSDYRLRVIRDERTLRSYSVSDLERLGAHRVFMQDQWEEGPRLLDALKEAGVTSFEQVRVVGLGVRDDGELTLDRSDIDGEVLLDIAKRGTAKVCGPQIPYEERVRDVVELHVR